MRNHAFWVSLIQPPPLNVKKTMSFLSSLISTVLKGCLWPLCLEWRNGMVPNKLELCGQHLVLRSEHDQKYSTEKSSEYQIKAKKNNNNNNNF